MKRFLSMLLALTMAVSCLPALGLSARAEDSHTHSYVTLVSMPTCTQEGRTFFYCDCGDYYYGNYVDALGHTYAYDICTVCGTKYEVVGSGACGDALTWRLDSDGVLTITGTGVIYDYPYEYKMGVSSAPWAELTVSRVVVGEGVTGIGAGAFASTRVSDVSLPDGLTSIGEHAFCDCYGLSGIQIPASVTTIGESAFRSSGLTEITIPEGVTRLEDLMFYWCSSLKTVNLPDTLTHIDEWAFYYCPALEDVTIPENVEVIGECAFYNCTELTSVTIPANVSQIGRGAFAACENLTEIIFEGNVPEFGNTYGHSCFDGVTALAYYPANNFTWTEDVLLGYGGTLTWVAYGDPAEHVHSYAETVTAATCTEQGYTTYTCACGESYVGDYVEAAGHSYGQWYETVTPTVETEGEERRDCINCDQFETRVVDKMPPEEAPDNIVASGTCGENLTWTLDDEGTLTISGQGEMYEYGYYGELPWYQVKDDVREVVIGADVSSISERAFGYFDKMTKFVVDESNSHFTTDDYDVLFNKDKTELICAPGRFVFDYTIPEEVTKIGAGAFMYSLNLYKIEIPDGVTEIGENAFFNCSSLSQIQLPGSVVSIGDSAFENCLNLKQVELQEGVVSIGKAVFYNTKVASLWIPASVTSIGANALVACPLETVQVNENNPRYFCDEYGALYDKVDAVLVFVPTSISAYNVPDFVSRIGERAFHNRKGLTEITIPANVREIDIGAFQGCSNLTSITFSGDAPQIQDLSFSNVTADVYYPGNNDTWTSSKMKDYSGKLTWIPYAPETAAPGDVNGDGTVDNVDAMLILQFAVGLNDGDGLNLNVCDMDGSGTVDNVDAMLILQMAVGLIHVSDF